MSELWRLSRQDFRWTERTRSQVALSLGWSSGRWNESQIQVETIARGEQSFKQKDTRTCDVAEDICA